VLALLLMATCAKAERMSGNFLLEQCAAPISESRLMCTSYILGYVDATVMWNANASGIPICIPSEEVIARQIVDVVVKWLKAHPQDRDRAAAILVADALEEAWPCKQGTLIWKHDESGKTVSDDSTR
jgi:hypothetical protein